MPNAPGLRDQRLRLYKRLDRGTDGYTQSVFVFDAERWGRLDTTHGSVLFLQERLQMHVDAACEFADEVKPPMNGLIIDAPTMALPIPVCWWVRGIYGSRRMRRVLVACERVADEQFSQLTLYDSADVSSTHAVNPFNLPPNTTILRGRRP